MNGGFCVLNVSDSANMKGEASLRDVNVCLGGRDRDQRQTYLA